MNIAIQSSERDVGLEFVAVVSGSHDRTVIIWDAQTGTAIREPLQGHEHWVTSVAFSPDGARIVSGSSDKVVRGWSTGSSSSCKYNQWTIDNDGWI
ncbi:hypothetical protein D9758_014016 [Tetrapyrgos nigripes]|uniref:WD40 repeat-like protein n=1 Tax=Tetrapyrgos nigripes TaxID=182062 RepID=A0A8H5CZ97_9AGAR|nr:hypothetical protein D9758_014016 [Tetrapyrgos nigripes]